MMEVTLLAGNGCVDTEILQKTLRARNAISHNSIIDDEINLDIIITSFFE